MGGKVLWAGEGEKARYYANEGKGKRGAARYNNRGKGRGNSGGGKGAWIPRRYMTKGQRARNGL